MVFARQRLSVPRHVHGSYRVRPLAPVVRQPRPSDLRYSDGETPNLARNALEKCE